MIFMSQELPCSLHLHPLVLYSFVQSPPDPMHTLPLGITKHMLYALVWVIQDFILGFHHSAHSSPMHSAQSSQNLSGAHRDAPAPPPDGPHRFFDHSDVAVIVKRICVRLHVIRCTCQGLDLTAYMCEEPQRAYEQMHSGSHTQTAYLRAHEYMILSMLMPYVLVDLMQPEMQWLSHQFEEDPPPIIRDRMGADPMQHVVKAWYMYMDFFCFLRQTVMTESQVCQLEVKARELQRFLWIAFPLKAGQKQGWNFPKYHHLDTLATTIRMFGSANWASTQATEHCHVYYSKKLVLLTNGKDAFNQIMNIAVRKNLLRDLTLFTNSGGIEMHEDFHHQSYHYSRSQVYSFPIYVLFNEPERVTRSLTAAPRMHNTQSKIRYERLSSFTGADAAETWGQRHTGFLFLPHLLGVFLVTRRNRFNILLEHLQKVSFPCIEISIVANHSLW